MKNKPIDNVLGLHAVHKLAGDVKTTFDTIVRSSPRLLSYALLCSCSAHAPASKGSASKYVRGRQHAAVG